MQAQPAASNGYGEKVVRRYTDAYRLGRTIVWVGSLVKIVGIVAGLLIGLISAGLAGQMGGRSSASGALILGVIVGGCAWFVFWVIGVLVSAQGQILKANIDEAVNTSPFLVDDQRVRIMSLA